MTVETPEIQTIPDGALVYVPLHERTGTVKQMYPGGGGLYQIQLDTPLGPGAFVDLPVESFQVIATPPQGVFALGDRVYVRGVQRLGTVSGVTLARYEAARYDVYLDTPEASTGAVTITAEARDMAHSATPLPGGPEVPWRVGMAVDVPHLNRIGTLAAIGDTDALAGHPRYCVRLGAPDRDGNRVVLCTADQLRALPPIVDEAALKFPIGAQVRRKSAPQPYRQGDFGRVEGIPDPQQRHILWGDGHHTITGTELLALSTPLERATEEMRRTRPPAIEVVPDGVTGQDTSASAAQPNPLPALDKLHLDKVAEAEDDKVRVTAAALDTVIRERDYFRDQAIEALARYLHRTDEQEESTTKAWPMLSRQQVNEYYEEARGTINRDLAIYKLPPVTEAQVAALYDGPSPRATVTLPTLQDDAQDHDLPAHPRDRLKELMALVGNWYWETRSSETYHGQMGEDAALGRSARHFWRRYEAWYENFKADTPKP